jgi:hypothetical protein
VIHYPTIFCCLKHFKSLIIFYEYQQSWLPSIFVIGSEIAEEGEKQALVCEA